MKKLFVTTLLFVFSLFIGGSAVAFTVPPPSTPTPYAFSGTYYDGSSTFSGNFDWGISTYKAYDPQVATNEQNSFSSASSSQTVESKATAGSNGIGPVETTAEGYARQYSGAGVSAPYGGTWAYGSQSSWSTYKVEDYSDFLSDTSYAEGTAKATGGILVGATRFDTRSGNTSIAGGFVGSMNSVDVVGSNYETEVFGGGYVNHATFAQKGPGWNINYAKTFGRAVFTYNEVNGQNSSMGGFAATGGYSHVTYNNCGVSAIAISYSISSGGYAMATSNVHIRQDSGYGR